MAKITTLPDLLIEELKDLYSAENQLAKVLPKMAKAASSGELAAAFEDHLEQTLEHTRRLEAIGRQLDCSLKGKTCKAMEGLVAEGRQIIDEDASPVLHDLALIGAAQRVEHYEISGYGTARTLAEAIGETEIAAILQQTLDEENEADQALTTVAAGCIAEAAETSEVP